MCGQQAVAITQAKKATRKTVYSLKKKKNKKPEVRGEGWGRDKQPRAELIAQHGVADDSHAQNDAHDVVRSAVSAQGNNGVDDAALGVVPRQRLVLHVFIHLGVRAGEERENLLSFYK